MEIPHTIGGIVRLAEWIIDFPCLVRSCFISTFLATWCKILIIKSAEVIHQALSLDLAGVLVFRTYTMYEYKDHLFGIDLMSHGEKLVVKQPYY